MDTSDIRKLELLWTAYMHNELPTGDLPLMFNLLELPGAEKVIGELLLNNQLELPIDSLDMVMPFDIRHLWYAFIFGIEILR